MQTATFTPANGRMGSAMAWVDMPMPVARSTWASLKTIYAMAQGPVSGPMADSIQESGKLESATDRVKLPGPMEIATKASISMT